MSIGDLSNKLKERICQDREKLEQIAHDEFASLQQSLVAKDQGKFIVLPPNTSIKTGWTIGNNEVIKLE